MREKWWEAPDAVRGLGIAKLGELVDVGTLVAEGRVRAGRKFDGGGVRRRLYAVIYVAVHAEATLRRRLSDAPGNTHRQIADALGCGEDRPKRWLKTSDPKWLDAGDLVMLMAADALSPPVRAWLIEQVGFEAGFTAVVDDIGGPAASSDGPDEHMTDITASVGRLAGSIREARAGGIDRDEASAMIHTLRGVRTEVGEFEAALMEMANAT